MGGKQIALLNSRTHSGVPRSTGAIGRMRLKPTTITETSQLCESLVAERLPLVRQSNGSASCGFSSGPLLIQIVESFFMPRTSSSIALSSVIFRNLTHCNCRKKSRSESSGTLLNPGRSIGITGISRSTQRESAASNSIF